MNERNLDIPVVTRSAIIVAIISVVTALLEPRSVVGEGRCQSNCRGCDIMRGAVSQGLVSENFIFAFPNDAQAPALFGSLVHVWTRCSFGNDSLVIYNRFKAKRINGCAENIAYYYVYGGDKDSWYQGSNCEAVHVDLPTQRRGLIARYGPITRIEPIDHPPECKQAQDPKEHVDTSH